MSESSLGHVPAKEKWEFDAGVTDVFDDMLRRSIPQYEVMRRTVADLAREFMRQPGAVVDLGSSRGETLAPLLEDERAGRPFVAVETSPPMLAVLRSRFEREIAALRLFVSEQDLREARDGRSLWGHQRASVVLSVLTLQFVPINYRQGILREVHRKLAPGGALLFVEKVLGDSAEIDATMVAHYHGLKGANGYGREEIDRKALSLEGVLVPVTAKWNEDLLRQAGFRHVDCFWRWMNFAGWLAVRDER